MLGLKKKVVDWVGVGECHGEERERVEERA